MIQINDTSEYGNQYGYSRIGCRIFMLKQECNAVVSTAIAVLSAVFYKYYELKYGLKYGYIPTVSRILMWSHI